MGVCSSKKKEEVKVVVDDIKKLYSDIETLVSTIPEVVADNVIKARQAERKSTESEVKSRAPSLSVDQQHMLYQSIAENKIALQSFAESTVREIQLLKCELDKKIPKADV